MALEERRVFFFWPNPDCLGPNRPTSAGPVPNTSDPAWSAAQGIKQTAREVQGAIYHVREWGPGAGEAAPIKP